LAAVYFAAATRAVKSCENYSERNVAIGSVRAARNAGTRLAAQAAHSVTNAAPA
jgi:hypothetical protein